MSQDIRGRVYVPDNGESYSFDFKNPRKQLSYSKDIKPLNSEGLTEENIEKLWEHIYRKTGTDIGFSVEEIVFIQEGMDSFGSDKVERYLEILNNSKYFTPNRRRLFLYHPVSEEDLAEDDGIMEMNQMFSVVDSIFPPETGLYKRGARIEENIILLDFNFPAVAQKKFKDEIEKLKEETGWEVELNEDCNQIALEELAYKLLPRDINVKKISYYRDKKKCELSLNHKPADIEKITAEFYEKSGIELLIDTPEGVVGKRESLSLREIDSEQMMEQNQAFAYIDEAFKSRGVEIYKKSRKVADGIPYMEIYFISPEVGSRYQEKVDKLEVDTGWNIKIGNTAIQNEIIKIVKRMALDYDIRLKKNPGLYTDRAQVKVDIDGELTVAETAEFKQNFKERTGYEIIL